ncbi:hypothetical protein BDV12DRAFT_159829 [Aspergillus spectabilis]
MEFFDFDEAASGSHVRDDDVASDHLEIDENDAMENYQSLLQDQSFGFPGFVPKQATPEGAMAETPDPEGVYPMFRAKEPCDFCRNMGLDCFVAKRGVMQKSGCTCCISLYRECSFYHTMPQGKFLDTLHPISENIDIPTGGLTGKKALKSFSGITEDVDARSRKSSSRLSREAVRILKTWLNEHTDHPYPSEDEKEDLKLRTGLKRTQITNWLANARRRGKVRPAPRSSSPVPGAIEIPRQPQRDLTLMTPLERWKYSPPENEPAAMSNILRALEDTSLEEQRTHPAHVTVRSHSRRTGSSNESSHANSNVLDAISFVSSHETSRSASRSSVSDLSFASAFSHRSSLSFGSMDRKERRRRRKPSTPANAFAQQKAKNTRIYQCTFCADSFQTKYDWQRHEKSLHLALEKWTCAPHGGVVFLNGINRCAFCMAANPDNDHLEAHNYTACAEKTLAERTFYRKDHLNQHLRLMHNVRFDPSMDQWRSHTTEIISRCGFCGITLTTWKGRADHLATHFKNGADMVQWQGDWGFEPVVQSLVENAMPPYLIGQERNTLDPFAFSLRHVGLSIPEDVNCYQRLGRELTAFIEGHVRNGVVPTDQMIQDQGRRVIYGTDDPWNQTCADNPVWLAILKRDAGVEPAPGSENIDFDNLGMQPPYASQEGLRKPPICTRQPYGARYPSSGFQSPAIPGTGRSSTAPSVPGSSSGSFSGSMGAFSATRPSGLSADWGSSASVGVSSFSTPLSTSVDPFVQMGFDPEFLQQLNTRYEEELPLDGLQGLNFGADNVGVGGFNAADPMDTAVVTSATAPIAIPTSKQPDIVMPDVVARPDFQFESTDRT